jgi:hypothetical protein
LLTLGAGDIDSLGRVLVGVAADEGERPGRAARAGHPGAGVEPGS